LFVGQSIWKYLNYLPQTTQLSYFNNHAKLNGAHVHPSSCVELVSSEQTLGFHLARAHHGYCEIRLKILF